MNTWTFHECFLCWAVMKLTKEVASSKYITFCFSCHFVLFFWYLLDIEELIETLWHRLTGLTYITFRFIIWNVSVATVRGPETTDCPINCLFEATQTVRQTESGSIRMLKPFMVTDTSYSTTLYQKWQTELGKMSVAEWG